MTETILLAGTGSHVGKSVIAAGLCRLLRNRGVAVAPFKAQNMSNNARVVISPGIDDPPGETGERTGETSETYSDDGATQDGKAAERDVANPDWGEIGVSQYVQARASGLTPTTDMNPVLLKPRGDGESQLVLRGQAHEHLEPGAYYGSRWEAARSAAEGSFHRLAPDHDVIVAEGAGSIAEINLHDRDLANVETARFADAHIVLIGDIERGGVFASLWGTLDLMPADLRGRVVGVIINKFRGSRSVLDPGIEEFEEIAGVPVLGVLPYDDPGLPEEDSVSLPSIDDRTVFGADDRVGPSESVTIGVPRLPFISNFTDMEPLALEPGVRVVYLPPDGDLSDIDAVVLPGSKNTVDDLLALTEAGFDAALRQFDGPVVGICGGYQMLGERIRNAGIESTQASGTLDGLGLLPVETTFSEDKVVSQTTCTISGMGPIVGASGTASGYEIHMGTSVFLEDLPHPLDQDSAVSDGVLGTYLHGLFENDPVRTAFIERIYEHKGMDRPTGVVDRPSPYENAAALLENHLDLGRIDALSGYFS